MNDRVRTSRRHHGTQLLSWATLAALGLAVAIVCTGGSVASGLSPAPRPVPPTVEIQQGDTKQQAVFIGGCLNGPSGPACLEAPVNSVPQVAVHAPGRLIVAADDPIVDLTLLPAERNGRQAELDATASRSADDRWIIRFGDAVPSGTQLRFTARFETAGQGSYAVEIGAVKPRVAVMRASRSGARVVAALRTSGKGRLKVYARIGRRRCSPVITRTARKAGTIRVGLRIRDQAGVRNGRVRLVAIFQPFGQQRSVRVRSRI